MEVWKMENSKGKETEGESRGKSTTRREQLYGTARTEAREAAQELQQQDHVFENFQRGTQPMESYSEALQSETIASFRHRPTCHSGLRSDTKWSPASQNTTHLKFGSDPAALTSVVRADYTTKPLSEYKQIIPDGLNDIHLADMAPRYMADKSFGKSLYNTDFDGPKSYRTWSSQTAQDGRKVGRRQVTTQYQKATHFQLGSDPLDLVSETGGCFTARQPVDPLASGPTETAVSAVPDRSKSNVFRPGDYNAPSFATEERFLSVQQKDFGPRRLLPAGVSTATRKGYSHVFPRKPTSSGQAISALRRLLIEKNMEEFTNPRDPTAINARRAFLKYDKNRSAGISVDELKAVCSEMGTPVTDEEIVDLLKECDRNGVGRIDYVEFMKYLTAHTEPQPTEKAFVSTHSETYSSQQEASEKEEDPFMGVEYQTSTHFQLGDDKPPPASIYSNDFAPESVRGTEKFLRAPPPPSSKVMHEFLQPPADSAACTTSRKEYVRHNVAAREGERLACLRRNRGRDEKLAVVFSCDKDGHKDQYKSSVMGSSYISPPSGTGPAHPIDPAPKDYHHLESNRALPHPPKGPVKTEVQECFDVPVKSEGVSVGRTRAVRGERTSRMYYNKGTHFFLGFSKTPPLSEQATEFAQKQPVDPGLPAAGKPTGPTRGYPVIGHDSGEVEESPAESGETATAEDHERKGLQGVLQQRNFLRNVNPRDPLNINLRRAFLEYDKDLSGTISREEVTSVCQAMGVSVSEKELEEMIARCDKNRDGQIDYHEFALHLSRQQLPTSSEQATTTTRSDFRRPQDQQLTPMQKLVIKQDALRHVPQHPTHFFHLDCNKDYLCSTTRKDFVQPEEVH